MILHGTPRNRLPRKNQYSCGFDSITRYCVIRREIALVDLHSPRGDFVEISCERLYFKPAKKALNANITKGKKSQRRHDTGTGSTYYSLFQRMGQVSGRASLLHCTYHSIFWRFTRFCLHQQRIVLLGMVVLRVQSFRFQHPCFTHINARLMNK